MSRVLILTETVAGWGHYSAAKALEKALIMKKTDVEVTVDRILPKVSRLLEKMIGTCYMNTLKYAPALWGAAYGKDRWFSRVFKHPLGIAAAAVLRPLIREVRPRVVVCTHALPLAACAQMKREGAGFALGAAVTDFDVHSFWLAPEVDFYFLAHEKLAEKLSSLTGPSALLATGIPIDPAFSRLDGSDKEKLRQAAGLHPDRFTLLFLGGGGGLGPLNPCLRHLTSRLSGANMQLVVITGNNRRLYDDLIRRYGSLSWVHPLKFVNNMSTLMAASDLVIGKPGGMTSSEALAAGLPMLIVKPIPGQEENNSRFLLNKKVALREDRPERVASSLLSLWQDPGTLEEMARRARLLGKPRSALDAAEVVLQHL